MGQWRQRPSGIFRVISTSEPVMPPQVRHRSHAVGHAQP
jgi:hypothetical protein